VGQYRWDFRLSGGVDHVKLEEIKRVKNLNIPFDLCGKNKVTENKNMKKKYLTILSILIIIAVSACGPAPAPTLSVADIQGTAVADAWIAITLTQAAIPTATQTPIPPTITLAPLPTATLLLIPTLAPVPAATLPDTSASDPCNLPPPAEPKGKMVKIKFVNKADSNINLSFGMIKENDQKECGTYGYTIGRYEEPEVQVLAGCYWAYAWVINPPSDARNLEVLCVTDTSKVTSIWISNEVIAFH
jgi:hypothetical protein